jgi:hypothetical protein
MKRRMFILVLFIILSLGLSGCGTITGFAPAGDAYGECTNDDDCNDLDENCKEGHCIVATGVCIQNPIPDTWACRDGGDPGKCCEGVCDNDGDTTGDNFEGPCRTGPSCIAAGNYGYEAGNDGGTCGDWVKFCKTAATCDDYQHHLTCDSGFCDGDPVAGADKDVAGSEACGDIEADCGTCCTCDEVNGREYDSFQDGDCDANVIGQVAECGFNPDNIAFTYDSRNAFVSQCHALDQCTGGDATIDHDCSIGDCGAECEVDADCDIDSNPATIDICDGNCECDYDVQPEDCVVDTTLSVSSTVCSGSSITVDSDIECVNPDGCECGALTATLDPTGTPISDCTELQNMNLADAYYLANDIDCSGTTSWNGGVGFDPIGDSTTKFTGAFDGNDKKITGLYINRPTENYIGLFGYIDSGSSVVNVGLENVDITGQNYVGGLVGRSDANIVKSYATGSVAGVYNVGGLVGQNRGIIKDSYSRIDVVFTSSYGAGLVGTNYQGSIIDSYATGSVTGGQYGGGLVANNNQATITNSYATGSVTGSFNIGGLVGINQATGTITNSYWDVSRSGETFCVGTGSSAGCTGKNIGNSQPDYFYYSSNPPMNAWDFTDVWLQVAGDYPVFIVTGGPKGIIPMYSGTPFYASDPNPQTGGCLDGSMTNGEVCSSTWNVIATGSSGTYDFFVIYENSTGTVDTSPTASVTIGAGTELCNGYDDDCDGDSDEGFDTDGNGYDDNDWDDWGDGCDNCPNDANPNQDNSDSDGWGDACDNCLNDDNQDQLDSDNQNGGDLCDICPLDDTDTCDPYYSGGGSVGTPGGTVTNPGGTATIIVPPGAVTTPTSFSITQDPSIIIGYELVCGVGAVGFGYLFGPQSITFAVPVTVILTYSDSEVTDESKLDIYMWDGTDWIAQGATVDTVANTLTLDVTIFGLIYVIAESDTGPDLDCDGVPDVDDLCPGTEPWYASERLLPNHYDSSNLDLILTGGCSAFQILECHPGNVEGQYKYGISQGTLNTWINMQAWARDEDGDGSQDCIYGDETKDILIDVDSDAVIDPLDGDNDGDGIPDAEDTEPDSSSPGDGLPGKGTPDWWCDKHPGKC